MSQNWYAEINLHFVWHTKGSAPLLTPEVEPAVHRFLRGAILDTPGVYFHEIGGTETHVHVAVSIPPTLNISTFIGQLKGAASHEVNLLLGRGVKILQWQEGYGVVSFGTANRDWVCAYIRNQKQHHAAGMTVDRFERIDRDSDDSA